MKHASISLRVNGRDHQLEVEVRKLLVDVLREDLGLTGTHIGCEHGICGACTILLNQEAVRSCLTFAVQADGAEITTIEGLAGPDSLHPLQEAFWEEHAGQCCFCTPGMILTAHDFLKENPRPTDAEIREAISGNLCMCTGYVNIVKAIRSGAEHLASARIAETR